MLIDSIKERFLNWQEEARDRYFELGFSKDQQKGILIIFGGFIAVGAIFFALSQGGESKAAPMPVITLPKVAPTPSVIIVDVAGKVVKPGVYKLDLGARAIDALSAAGGAKSGVDLSDINLAHVLTDGEQIIVGAPKTITSTSKSSKSKAKVTSGPININTATAAQLDSLPGIGPVMANRIISYRQKNGLFKALDELRKVPGMGAAKYAEILSQIKI